MNVIQMRLDELFPYENNPRKNESAVAPVAESIKKFGFRVPIIVDKNNEIVTGHTRYLAAKELGLASVPVIRADDLTEAQVTAFRLVDNKTNEFAAWDFDKLDEEIAKVDCLDLDKDLDMKIFGFDDISNDNLDGLFEDDPASNSSKEKKGKKVVCPNCGHEFTA